MTEQLDLHDEPGWKASERGPVERIPKEFSHKPALELCWRGLVISISEGQMTRRQAYEMLARMDSDEGKEPANVYDLDAFRRQEPDDIVA